MNGAPAAAYPILYSFRRCPYAMRARLALLASDACCELREVVLADKPRALIDASPKATVPVLVDTSGEVIDESLDIMLWALRRNDPLTWLTPPADPLLDETFALIARCDGEFKPLLDAYKYPERHPGSSARSARDAAGTFLPELESRLSGSPALFGPQPSLADAAIAPFVRQFAAVDPADFAVGPWPCLHHWLRTFVDSALFERCMVRYAVWSTEQDRVLFGTCGD